MTIDFVGDWCSPLRDKGTSMYKLPSWTDEGKCTDILSIDKYGFYFKSEKINCEPVNIRLGNDTRPVWHHIHGYSHRPLPARWPGDSSQAPDL